MNIAKICFLIVIFVIFSSCGTISPWKTVIYRNLETQNIPSYGTDNLPDKVKYNKYFVNDAFVLIAAKSKDETVYEGTGPYSFSVTVIGEVGKHESFTIKEIQLQSNKGLSYSLAPLKFPIT